MEANLEILGNFQGYKHEPRIVVSESPLDLGNPMMFLKFYNMFKKGEEPVMKRDVDFAKSFIETEARMSRLDAESGLGFIIMSGDTLNVARWSGDKDKPYLLKNVVYEWEVEDGATIATKKLDINKKGAFCGFELMVGAHESAAWLKYLTSDRRVGEGRERAKTDYVNNVFVGEI